MQTAELEESLRDLAAVIPPPGSDLRDRVIEGARRRRLRRRCRQVAGALVASAALVLSVTLISPGSSRQVVKVGPSSTTPGSSVTAPPPVPPAIVNVLAQARLPIDFLEHITEVSLKEMTWRDFARAAPPEDTKGVTLMPEPTDRIYVILQTGGSNDQSTDWPPGRWPYRWAIDVMSIEASTGGEHIDGLANGKGQRPTLRPSFWAQLPGTEYVLDIATGKITVHRHS